MRAAVAEAPGEPLVVATVPDPDPPPHGAVVQVRATGVCRSDWHAWVGHDPTVRFPHVHGHEFAGVVESVGPEVKGFRGGEAVTAPFCCGCGACAECRSGHQNLCVQEYQPGFDGWGSFAERVVVPWADVNLVPLPGDMGFGAAAGLGCRFATAFRGVVDRVSVEAGESVVVYGCGGVGLSAVMIAAALGARVIGVDLEPSRLELARELGADAVVDASGADPVEAVLELTAGGAHVSVDALGATGTFQQGIRSLRRRGRHLQLGLLLGDDSSPPAPMHEVIRRELSVVGSHGMQAWRYADMLAFISTRRLPVERMVGDRRPLHHADAVIRSMGAFTPLGVTLLEP